MKKPWFMQIDFMYWPDWMKMIVLGAALWTYMSVFTYLRWLYFGWL